MHRPHRHPGAFTLIELLVVISIIAVLVGLLVPGLGRARDASRNVKCLANLKSIGLGMQMYMDTENKGKLLPLVRPLNTGSNDNDPSLLDIMVKYVETSKPQRSDANDPDSDWIVGDPWRCPSDSRSFDTESGFRPQWQQFGTSYNYPPGEAMTVGELIFLKDRQGGVSKAIEIRNNRIPVVMDADNWHNPRWEQNVKNGLSAEEAPAFRRNGVFAGDWRAESVMPLTPEEQEAFIADIIKFGGGIRP